MKRNRLVPLMALAAAIPAAAIGAYATFGAKASTAKPCFASGAAGYRILDSATAQFTVRIDNDASSPSLRLQIVDDAAGADFVLVDDGDAAKACAGVAAIKTIRIDSKAKSPDVTVSLSRETSDLKIYARSAHFSAEDAAAFFAVMWSSTPRAASNRKIAARN